MKRRLKEAHMRDDGDHATNNNYTNIIQLADMETRRHRQRGGAKHPLGHLYGGDLQFRCIRCNRAMRPSDITMAGLIVVIDCACGERSEIWPPEIWDDAT